MNQKELIDTIAKETDLPKTAVEKVFIAFSGVVHSALRMEGEVTLPNLGKLKLADTAARQGRNPTTGETINIPAKKRVAFKAGKSLKAAVN